MTNSYTNTRIEYHILQSFPVTCLNRDDVEHRKPPSSAASPGASQLPMLEAAGTPGYAGFRYQAVFVPRKLKRFLFWPVRPLALTKLRPPPVARK